MKTTTKRLMLTTLLAMVMLLSCAIGGLVALADDTDPAWVVSDGVSANYDQASEMWHVSGLNTGLYASYNQKVELNGLKVTIKPDNIDARTILGFGITSSPNVNPLVGDNLTASYVMKYNDAQTRFAFYTGSIVGSKDPTTDFTFLRKTLENAKDEVKSSPFSIADSNVLVYPDENVSTEMLFSYIAEDDVWQVDFHFNFTSAFQGSPADVTAYFNSKYVSSVLDDEGKCYITAYAKSSAGASFKFQDAYDLVTLPAAEQSLAEYKNQITAITDVETFKTAVTMRNSLLDSISKLKDADKTRLQAELAEEDKTYISNSSLQNIAKQATQAAFDTASEKLEVVENPYNASSANLKAASEACQAAVAAYNEIKDLLTAENKTYFENLVESQAETLADASENKLYWKDADWNTGGGAPYAEYNVADAMSHIYINTYAASMTYKYKVKLEGLKVYMEVGNMSEITRSTFGFGFSATDRCNTTNFPWYLDNAFCASFWPHQSASQTRLLIACNHNIDNGSCYIAYRDPELTNQSVGAATSFVYDYPGVASVTLEFHYNEAYDVWEVDVSAPNSAAWASNVSKFYFDRKWVDSVLDANGELYITVMGQSVQGLEYADGYLKIEDDNYREYKAGAYADAEAAADAYAEAIKAIVDLETYEASVSARELLESKILALRGNDALYFNEYVKEIDKLYTDDDDVQAMVASVLDGYFKVTDQRIALLDDEANITDDNIMSAANARNLEKDAYENMANMLTDENKESFLARRSEHLYAIELAEAKLWVITYEGLAEDLKTTQLIDLVDAIVYIKEFRADFANTEAYRIMTTRLESDDSDALMARIEDADAVAQEVESENASAVKDYYLLDFEDSLECDLTVKFNIDEAKKYYEHLIGKVTITSDDGEIYTRYAKAYATLKLACEAYVKGELDGVNESLKSTFTSYNAFKPVLARYKSISLGYLLEVNGTLTALYNTVTTAIEAEPFFNVTTTQIDDVAANKTGLYFEQTPSYPSRLNYNEELDLTKGVEIVVQLSEIAFYNDGARANNIVFNFLSEKNSYKGMSDGISILIWMYAQECNVWILNYTDIAIVQGVLTTPMEGSNITVSVKYEEYYDFVADATYWAYVIKINNAEFVVTKERLTANGHSVSDKCYFSMGSFADDTANPNCFTLVSVDGKSLAVVEKTSTDPVTPPATDDDNNEDDNKGNTPATSKKKKCGSSVAATMGGTAVALIAVSAVLLIRRKKSHNLN